MVAEALGGMRRLEGDTDHRSDAPGRTSMCTGPAVPLDRVMLCVHATPKRTLRNTSSVGWRSNMLCRLSVRASLPATSHQHRYHLDKQPTAFLFMTGSLNECVVGQRCSTQGQGFRFRIYVCYAADAFVRVQGADGVCWPGARGMGLDPSLPRAAGSTTGQPTSVALPYGDAAHRQDGSLSSSCVAVLIGQVHMPWPLQANVHGPHGLLAADPHCRSGRPPCNPLLL
jgi:hypothetical protein